MPKFEKKYCYCVWDNELKGKRCFVSDDIDALQRVVEVNDTNWLRDITGKSTYAPFPFSNTENYFRFCYHDPYYELKLAREEGKVIQRYWKSEQEWDEYIGDDFPDDISFYRIKPEEHNSVTNLELARWLAKGNGQWSYHAGAMVHSNFVYKKGDKDNPIEETIRIRKWEDEEWYKPSREYMGLED